MSKLKNSQKPTKSEILRKNEKKKFLKKKKKKSLKKLKIQLVTIPKIGQNFQKT